MLASNEERKWAVILHLAPLAGYLVPVAGFALPFTLWLLKKNDSAYLDEQGREVLNFVISVMAYAAIGLVLCLLLIGFALLWALGLFALILTIVAAVKTSDGINYKYPLIFRLI